ncbi:hypothetical protein EVA_17433 [gut metagenome]|uniref:Uncharacterized protein n=1 Tax=gut metagenome TaxID=749906 RepID=J9FHT6_9ZZZZ
MSTWSRIISDDLFTSAMTETMNLGSCFNTLIQESR